MYYPDNSEKALFVASENICLLTIIIGNQLPARACAIGCALDVGLI